MRRVLLDQRDAVVMTDCKDCGFDDYPIYKVIPYTELTFGQRFRVRLFGGGVYLRDQFGHTYYDPAIGSNTYGD